MPDSIHQLLKQSCELLQIFKAYPNPETSLILETSHRQHCYHESPLQVLSSTRESQVNS